MLQNWKTYKLGDFAKNVSRRFDFKSHKEVVFVNTSDVLEGKFLVSKLQSAENLPGQAKKAICKGDLLFSEIRPNNKRFALVNFDCSNYVVSTKFMVIVTDDNIVDHQYFYQLIKSKERLDELQTIAESRSGTFPQITFDAISSIDFILPPLHEQRAIASILSALDDKIELNLQMNKTLEEMAMAIYKHWFVDFGPFKDGEFVESELGMIPKGWEVKKLDDIVEIIIDHRGKTPKKLGGDWSDKSEGCYETISAKNIKAGKIVKPETIKYLSKQLFDKWMKIPLKDNDIILTSEAPIGEYYFLLNKTDYCLSQRLFAIRTNPKKMRSELLYNFIISPWGQQQLIGRGSGSTVQGIKQAELRKLNVLTAPVEIQNNVANEVLSLFKIIRNNDEENQTLTTQRDSLLPKLISGEIQVKDLEKN